VRSPRAERKTLPTRGSTVKAVTETAVVQCAGCQTGVVVLPSALVLGAEIEPDFLTEATTAEGLRFAYADDVGMWTCPACGLSSVIPVVSFN
jgi:hypothetical protein